MQIHRFSIFAACVALLAGCTTTQTSTSRTSAAISKGQRTARIYKYKMRNPVFKDEIAIEMKDLNQDPLPGPIDNSRLAFLLNEQQADVALAEAVKRTVAEQATVLSQLLADKGLSRKPAAAVAAAPVPTATPEPPVQLKTLSSLETKNMQVSTSKDETSLIFDIPVTNNARVSSWIKWFQTDGRKSFKTWLERSSRYVPVIKDELSKAGLPQDLVYVAMIESGFRADAVSHMGAMGLWQFIGSTGRRYGLRTDWWLDERRDYAKSTHAAISYMKDLNGQFNSWYLVTASYNMGESGVRRLMKRHNTNNYWELADQGVLPKETTDYVPKIIAATLIAKAPALYGFRELEYQAPLQFDSVTVPGGTDLVLLSTYLGVSSKYLSELNPELTRGFIPREVRGHQIRVPKGSSLMVAQFTRLQQQSRTRDVTQEAANN